MEEPQGQRNFTRVDFRITARVEVGGTVLEGTVENLSLRGMLMETDKKLPVGEHAEITITLADQQAEATETTGAAETHHNEDWPVIEVSGTVVRATAISTAFKFDLIDSDSFIHLKNIVALNSGDPEAKNASKTKVAAKTPPSTSDPQQLRQTIQRRPQTVRRDLFTVKVI